MSMLKNFVGCDTHKEKHFISIISETGEEKESFEISNTLKGWQEAKTKTEKYNVVAWGIENSPNYATQFCKYLLKEGEHLKEVNPVFTGKKRMANTCRSKTDKIDSLVIAKITRDHLDRLPDIFSDEPKEELKFLVKQRDDLVKEYTRVKNRLHAILTKVAPGYQEKYGKLKNVKAQKLIADDFKKSSKIHALVITMNVTRLQELKRQTDELKKRLDRQENELLKNLRTLKGLGPINAPKLISIVGDIKRFKSESHFASYTGVSPIERSSGKHTKKIKNKGANRQLNKVFYQLALSQIGRYGTVEAKSYYQKKLQETKSKKQAINCLMRRLVKIVYHMYRNNQPYNYPANVNIQETQAA
jgi:transposase